MMNEFETFTADLRKNQNYDQVNLASVRTLVIAFRRPRKVVVDSGPAAQVDKPEIIPWHRERDMGQRARTIEWVNAGLGVRGKLERVSTSDCDGLWFWEGSDGGKLKTPGAIWHS